MAVVRYEPFGLVNTRPSLEGRFDRLLEEGFGWGREAAPATRTGVAANLYETPDAYWVELPLAGVKPEDAQITVQQNVLTISAKRTWEMPQQARPIWQG